MRAGLARSTALIEACFGLLGRLLGLLLLAAVLITFTVVALRYLFSRGSIGLQESAQWAHAAVFMLGAGYALLRNAHVRVDVFFRGFTPRRQAWIEVLGGLLLLLPFAGFLFAASIGYVSDAWSISERSAQAGGLPGVWLLKTLIPALAVLIALAGLARMLRALLVLLPEREAPTP